MMVEPIEQSTPPRRRGRPPRETDAILKAAMRVFARDGYADTTIDEIALEARASTATLYKHFVNKAGLFSAVMKARAIEVEGIIAQKVNADQPILDQILSMLLAAADVLRDPIAQGLARAYVGEVHNSPNLTPIYLSNGALTVIQNLTRLIEAAQAQSVFEADRHAATAAHTAISVIERYTLLTALFFGEAQAASAPTSERMAEEALCVLCACIGTPETRASMPPPMREALARQSVS